MNQNSQNSFLICSGIFPLIAILLGVLMVVFYLKMREKTPLKVFAIIPAIGLLYAVVYTVIYCVISFQEGSFAPIFVIRSFEGFAIDLIVWLILMVHSSKTPSKPTEPSDDEKMDITNF